MNPTLTTPVLTEQHRKSLEWLEQRRGQVLTWEQLKAAPWIVSTKSKGIYKPKGSEYVLSIRQGLGSSYPDQEQAHQDDGHWVCEYAQEERDGGDSAGLYTNRAMEQCRIKGVPIAVLKQLSKKPDVVRYEVLGLAHVMKWKKGVFFLRSTTLAMAGQHVAQESESNYEHNRTDTRRRVQREITVRQGQPAFRKELLSAYDEQCAITGCAVVPVLEAAHITPYLGLETNHASNGLLLRSDLHTLWDSGLIYLNDDLTLQLAPSLSTSEYAPFAGKPIRKSASKAQSPSLAAIKEHREWCLLKLNP